MTPIAFFSMPIAFYFNFFRFHLHRYSRNYNGISIRGEVEDDLQGTYVVQAHLKESGSVVIKKINVEVHGKSIILFVLHRFY